MSDISFSLTTPHEEEFLRDLEEAIELFSHTGNTRDRTLTMILMGGLRTIMGQLEDIGMSN